MIENIEEYIRKLLNQFLNIQRPNLRIGAICLGGLSIESQDWLQQMLQKLDVEFSFSEVAKEDKIQISAIGNVSDDSLLGLAYWEIVDMLTSRERKVRFGQCAAEDCDNIFVPVPQGKTQRYCSQKCQKRHYKREYRKKQKEKNE